MTSRLPTLAGAAVTTTTAATLGWAVRGGQVRNPWQSAGLAVGSMLAGLGVRALLARKAGGR